LGDPVQEQATDDLVTAEIAGSPIKEGNVLTTELAPTLREEYTNIDVYHPPFTIYQQFIPTKIGMPIPRYQPHRTYFQILVNDTRKK
jgi:hypothetical protein